MKARKILRPDSKGRLSFGSILNGISSVRVQVEDDGRILLEPFVEIPEREAWLYDNPDALKRVRTGLLNVAEGALQYQGTFTKETTKDDT